MMHEGLTTSGWTGMIWWEHEASIDWDWHNQSMP